MTEQGSSLPHSRTIFVLGILSLVLSFAFGFILAVIALLLARHARRMYSLYPGRFTVDSYNRMAIGKMLSVAGLLLGGLISFYYLAQFFLKDGGFQ